MVTETRQAKSLRELADAEGVSVAVLIDRTVRKHGTVVAAAEALGVKPGNVYQWLSRNKYRVEVERAARIVRAG